MASAHCTIGIDDPSRRSSERSKAGQDFQNLTVEESLSSLKDYSSEYLPHQQYQVITEEPEGGGDEPPQPAQVEEPDVPTIEPVVEDADKTGEVDPPPADGALAASTNSELDFDKSHVC